MDIEIGAAPVNDDAQSDVRDRFGAGDHGSSILTMEVSSFLGTMARQELVQDVFTEDVPIVATSIEQQLECDLDGDEAMMSPLGSDDARSDQVNLVQMRYRNGIDEVPVWELQMEVDRASSETSVLLLLFICKYVGPAGVDQLRQCVNHDGRLWWHADWRRKWHRGHGGWHRSHQWQGPHWWHHQHTWHDEGRTQW